MENAWENISLEDYEAHMSLPEIYQMQTLNEIMRAQLTDYCVNSVAILGIAGGNGLEHIGLQAFKTVYGIDINKQYLNICKERYGKRFSHLHLMQMDISNTRLDLPKVELIIANLLIEYIGIQTFIAQLRKQLPDNVSCVIQKNDDDAFVSVSPYKASFAELSDIHTNIEKNEMVDELQKIGFVVTLVKEYPLPNEKKLIRLDFKRAININ